MAYFVEQIHVRIDEDREIIKRIDELMVCFPGRWRNQSDVIRSAINYMHRRELEEIGGIPYDRINKAMRFEDQRNPKGYTNADL